MSRSAARVEDMHICPLPSATPPTFAHIGGPILPRDEPRTWINGKPAARVGDKASCTIPIADTVRGGLMTVFIDGNPASRMFDKTDMGSVIVGSPDVLLGESSGAALTSFQAEWLYNYLDAQREVIPFEFVDYGCEVRADRMCELISALGIPVEKQWIHFTRSGGKLHVAIPKYPHGGVTWDWHVAPMVQVRHQGGIESQVIDPSLEFGRPVTIADWIRKQSKHPATTVTSATSKEVYRRAWNPNAESWDDSVYVERDRSITNRDLNVCRDARAKLPREGGRRIANKPVHH